MIFVNCPFLPHIKCLNLGEDEIINSQKLRDVIQFLTGIPGEYLSVFRGCHKVLPSEKIDNGATIFLGLSLPGGKGGFGSMLRAIGAQIEKTTNREACRDLTGRRLRDINEEQRLKKWLSKKAEREQEKLRRKKERLERLRHQPKHDFHDPEYNKQRSELPERIDDALTQGLQKKAPGKKLKRVKKDDSDDECKEILKKQCLLLGLNVPSSGSESTDLESDSDPETPSTEISSNDLTVCAGSSKTSEDIAGPSVPKCNSDQFSVKKEAKDYSMVSPPLGHEEMGAEERKTTGKEAEESENGCTLKNNVSKDKSSTCENLARLDLIKTENQEQPSEIKEQPFNSENQTETQEDDESIDLLSFTNVREIESLGLYRLKSLLMSLGLKCGGTIEERAQRLWSVRGLDPKEYPSSLKARQRRK